MALKEMPKVGDKVRYVGEEQHYMTVGKTYVVHLIDEDGDAVVRDDNGMAEYILKAALENYELVDEKPNRTTTDLIANLALRVGELELQNAQQAHEINELYRADAERGVLR